METGFSSATSLVSFTSSTLLVTSAIMGLESYLTKLRIAPSAKSLVQLEFSHWLGGVRISEAHLKILMRGRQSQHDTQWRASNYWSRPITNFWGGRQFFVAASPMWKLILAVALLRHNQGRNWAQATGKVTHLGWRPRKVSHWAHSASRHTWIVCV